VRAKEGTGLGLALVKALTAMHGGEATIESAVGIGTIVRVRLPHAAVDERGQRLPVREANVVPFRGAA
jgi:cell cycle sensor histidine kinase DivJ